jgi:C4-type Zn-finger protein
MEYTKINTPGLQWIFDYTYALCKIILGEIRSKYASIPIPDGDVALDGDTLRSEGIQERENLLENLRTTLENASRKNRMEAKKDELENMDYILSRVATKIYIG